MRVVCFREFEESSARTSGSLLLPMRNLAGRYLRIRDETMQQFVLVLAEDKKELWQVETYYSARSASTGSTAAARRAGR